jgi:DNA primase
MDEIKILHNLNKLNIRYEGQFNNKGWLSIICPFHSDSNFGNAFIHNTTVIKCFSCKTKGNLYKIVKLKYPDYNNKQVFEYLGEDDKSKLDIIIEKRKNIPVQKSQEKKLYNRTNVLNVQTREIDLNLYYCKTRNFTKEWIDNFKIKIVNFGYYKDYFVTPIYYNNELITYEYRKAYEYEYYKNLFKVRNTLENYRNRFKQDKHLLDINTDIYKYLIKPKVLYPYNTLNTFKLKDNIFNIDNLNYNDDLYICEGIAGTSIIWNTISKNVTCLYGVNYSNEQLSVLQNFKGKKIIVSDNDSASDTMIHSLSYKLENVYVFQTKEKGMTYLINKSNMLKDLEIK